MISTFSFDHFIEPGQAGSYFTIPFEMPADSAEVTIRYDYPRHTESGRAAAPEGFTPRIEANIIDIGLIDPAGRQVGASGSDKRSFTVSEVSATPGYCPAVLVPGTWQILAGAYKVAPEGVSIHYEVTVVPKRLRLLKGDLHTHTLASDGVHTVEELGAKAIRNGLDFLAITDHNQTVSQAALPRIPGLTLIPGVEWTHYRGHANFLGADAPYDGCFAANSDEDIRARFTSARERGALITINHPFEEICPFRLEYTSLPFDCIEVWNGPMREANLRAVGLWHNLLAAGRKLPMVGGSDYHRDTPFIFLGGPTTCVWSQSGGPSDILAALRGGHSYVIFAPNGPGLEFSAGEGVLPGDTVVWNETRHGHLAVEGLLAGDVVRLVTAGGVVELVEAPSAGRFETDFAMPAPGFARVEVLRAFLPGIPKLPALLSNPIYFDEG